MKLPDELYSAAFRAAFSLPLFLSLSTQNDTNALVVVAEVVSISATFAKQRTRQSCVRFAILIQLPYSLLFVRG